MHILNSYNGNTKQITKSNFAPAAPGAPALIGLVRASCT